MNLNRCLRKSSMTIKEKIEIYDQIKKGTPISEIVQTYRTSQPTVWRISQLNENQITNLRLMNPIMKNKKTSLKYEMIDDFVFQYVKKCNIMCFPICGFLIKEVALKYALKANNNKFKASNGWMEKFLKRHKISLNKICGESSSADNFAAFDFVKSFDDIKIDYEDSNIFNYDETGLFIKILPEQTYAIKGTTSKGFKKSKERVTILLGASMLGEKMPLLLIGKSKNPRSFKNKIIDENIIMYDNNKSAWMTKEIFERYFKQINKTMMKDDRKIMVLIDNCMAHKIDDFSNVKFVFLPPNTSSLIQPLDMGVIRNFKLKYRQAFLNTIYDSNPIIVKRNIKDFSLYRVVEHAAFAWEKVSVETIINCFKILRTYGNGIDITGVNKDLATFPLKYGSLIVNISTTDEYVNMDNKENLAIYNSKEFTKNYCDLEDADIPRNESVDNHKSILMKLKHRIIDAKRLSSSISSSITSSLFELENHLNEEIKNL